MSSKESLTSCMVPSLFFCLWVVILAWSTSIHSGSPIHFRVKIWKWIAVSMLNLWTLIPIFKPRDMIIKTNVCLFSMLGAQNHTFHIVAAKISWKEYCQGSQLWGWLLCLFSFSSNNKDRTRIIGGKDQSWEFLSVYVFYNKILAYFY